VGGGGGGGVGGGRWGYRCRGYVRNFVVEGYGLPIFKENWAPCPIDKPLYVRHILVIIIPKFLEAMDPQERWAPIVICNVCLEANFGWESKYYHRGQSSREVKLLRRHSRTVLDMVQKVAVGLHNLDAESYL